MIGTLQLLLVSGGALGLFVAVVQLALVSVTNHRIAGAARASRERQGLPPAWTYLVTAWTVVVGSALGVEMFGGPGYVVLVAAYAAAGTLRSWTRLGLMLHARRNRRELRSGVWWKPVSRTRAIGYDERGVIVAIDDRWPAEWLS